MSLTGPVPSGYRYQDFQPVWDLLSRVSFVDPLGGTGPSRKLSAGMNRINLSSMKDANDYDEFKEFLKDILISKYYQPLPYLGEDPNLGGWYAAVYLGDRGEIPPSDVWERVFAQKNIIIGEILESIIATRGFPRVFFIYVHRGRVRRTPPFRSRRGRKNNIQINPYLPTSETQNNIWLSTSHDDRSWTGINTLNTGPAHNYYFGREGVEIPFGNGSIEDESAIYSKSYDVMREGPFISDPFILIPLGGNLQSPLRSLNYPLGE
jgi:hypothetical protein